MRVVEPVLVGAVEAGGHPRYDVGADGRRLIAEDDGDVRQVAAEVPHGRGRRDEVVGDDDREVGVLAVAGQPGPQRRGEIGGTVEEHPECRRSEVASLQDGPEAVQQVLEVVEAGIPGDDRQAGATDATGQRVHDLIGAGRHGVEAREHRIEAELQTVGGPPQWRRGGIDTKHAGMLPPPPHARPALSTGRRSTSAA